MADREGSFMAPPADDLPSSSSWSVTPVLSLEEEQELEEYISGNIRPPLSQYFAAPILDKKQISRLVQVLSQEWPLPESQKHLKRVRSQRPHLEILLRAATEEEQAAYSTAKSCTGQDKDGAILNPESNAHVGLTLTEIFKDGLIDLGGLGEPFLVSVPSREARNQKEQQVWAGIWPSTYHAKPKGVNLEEASNGGGLSEEEKQRIGRYMGTALQAARRNQARGGKAVGAVIVDPKSGDVIAVGTDQTDRKGRPLLHACMVAIDLVAHGQGGGAYDCLVDLDPQRQKPPSASITETEGEKRKRAEGESADMDGLPYLCTGYDVYVTHEPCPMCCMALLHSRCSSVYYGCSSPGGALGSFYRLHCTPGLNHRFLVYRGVKEKECQALYSGGEI